MSMQIVTPVPVDDVTIQIKRMNKYISEANEVNHNSTYKALAQAEKELAHARGFYGCLKGLGLLTNPDLTADTIDMVARKIEGILEEKRRKDMPKWKS